MATRRTKIIGQPEEDKMSETDTAVGVVTTPPPAVPLEAAPKTARFDLPKGVVSPIDLHNYLVKNKYAAESLKPQQMYGFVKAPGKGDNALPVKWYDEEGNVYDKQSAEVLTRPGITSLQGGVDWWMARATKATTTASAPAGTADADGVEAPDASSEVEPEGTFEEAE